MSRICHEVIDAILSVIPLEETLFIEMLNEARESSLIKEPEDVTQWKYTAIIINSFINPPSKDWEFEVLSTFTMLPVETIKSQAKEHILNRTLE